MRLNQFLAKNTDLSRRKADEAISQGRVEINGTLAKLGDIVIESDTITLDGRKIKNTGQTITILLNKPVGYVCSKAGQGSKTIYDLLPSEYSNLNPVGRLDKNSSGLLLLTNNGNLANELSHPRYGKRKQYIISLNRDLEPEHRQMISGSGVVLDDGPSKLELENLDNSHRNWKVTMSEGRNRQIRRTFAALDYKVIKLHRTHFGPYALGSIGSGKTAVVNNH